MKRGCGEGIRGAVTVRSDMKAKRNAPLHSQI
jgi:hypothetical protein